MFYILSRVFFEDIDGLVGVFFLLLTIILKENGVKWNPKISSNSAYH